MRIPGLALLLAAITLLPISSGGRLFAQDSEALPSDKALVKGRVNGKYRMLLRQIKVAADRKQFSDYEDFGYRTETTCADYANLPKGYWVYVYPYWYIWRDRASDTEQKRGWGPEQV